MTKFLVFLCLLLVSAVPAVAEPAAAPPTLVISRSACAALVSHVPSADSAYRGGVDARGRPVAPADVSRGIQPVLPEQISIDITVDLKERFNLPDSAGLYKGEAQIGTVVWRDGRAWLNGAPLTSEEEALLAASCAQSGAVAK